MYDSHELCLDAIHDLEKRLEEARQKVVKIQSWRGREEDPEERAHLKEQADRTAEAYRQYFLSLSRQMKIRIDRVPFQPFDDNNTLTLKLIDFELSVNLIGVDSDHWRM